MQRVLSWMLYYYTPRHAEGYIIFVIPFVRSYVRSFVKYFKDVEAVCAAKMS